jgi:Laminin G domain
MAATTNHLEDNSILHTESDRRLQSECGGPTVRQKPRMGRQFRGANKSIKTLLVLILCFVFKLNLCYGFILDGSQNSFAQFRKWYTGLNGSLELEFKTEQPNGLVLYTDDGGTYDFFELKLVEGALRLRYNLGGGAQIITVGRDLHDSHWHKVQVSATYIFIHYLNFIFATKALTIIPLCVPIPIQYVYLCSKSSFPL